MRTRTSGSITSSIVKSAHLYYRPDGSLYTTSYFTGLHKQDGIKSTIVDDPTPSKIKKTKPVTHSVISVKTMVAHDLRFVFPNTYGFDSCICGGIAPKSLVNESWTLFPSAGSMQKLHNEAFAYFVNGCVEKKVDLVNFIVELPQLKSLVPNLLQVGKLLAKGRRIGKSVADLTLSYNFGVLPVISDIRNMYNHCKSLHNHVEWLRKNNGRPVRVDFRKQLGDALRPQDTAISNRSSEFVKHTQFALLYHAFATITYDVSKLTDLELKLRALTRANGLDNPIASIYEGIPFSFIVDWVTDFGNVIEMLRIPVDLPLKFHDLGWSLKGVHEYSTFYSLWPSYSPRNRLTEIQRVYKKYYKREPGLSTSFAAASLSGITAKQAALGLALAVQKYG